MSGEHRAVYILLLLHGDRSGTQRAWGPFESEDAAESAKKDLTDWGLSGEWGVLPVWHPPVPFGDPR